VQVLKKGVFFPARANRLYEPYTRHNSIDEIDPKTRIQIQEDGSDVQSTRLASGGSPNGQVNYQIQFWRALGAFNQWIKGTELEPWRNRHVAVICKEIMQTAADLVTSRLWMLAKAATEVH
jgi:trans-AT polyketide synthase, acyltransferase and oxidoreductase domains